MGTATKDQVKTRRVFYIPGYDPMPPRRYRELYRTESAAQAEISGYDIAIKPKQVGDTFGWQVEASIDGAEVQTQIDVLVWSDIVRDSMATTISATYAQLLRTAWIYISSGTLWRLTKLRKGPVIAALYPVAMLLGQLVLAVLAGSLFNVAADAVLVPTMGMAGEMISLGLSVGLLVVLLRWFKKHDGRVFAYYLMHDYAHAASENGSYPATLETRLQDFRAKILAALQEPTDEVLVVGHSSGAYLAVSVLSDLLHSDAIPADAPALSFLSLGQVIPMVSFLPDATRLRTDLRDISQSDALTWVDVTAPGDGCAFALCDPVAVSGVASGAKRWPLVFSAAFTQSLSPARWRALRWRFFRLHFQYLCAFDRPKDYDYFQITAGPLKLGQRYADRVASRSRIEQAVNKYTSVSA